MTAPSLPIIRTLRLLLVATAEDVATTAWADRACAETTCAAVEHTLDVLASQAPSPGADAGERVAMLALRAEVLAQVGLVRSGEPGAVKRLTGLLHLLIEAELRHMQRAAELD